jgi:hypothetical protein
MQETIYPLKDILDTFTSYNGKNIKKRLIFDQMPIGGIAKKWIILFFLLLPILLTVGIFNPSMFAMLGIAQAIIFFIVFLSMVMIMIFALSFINNNKVTRQITPSWQHYFPGIDLKMILTSGATPYKNFFKAYEEILNTDSTHLEEKLQASFVTMEKENVDLLEMINTHR